MNLASRLWVVFLGLLLGLAGFSKMDSPLALLAGIYSYQIPIPDWLAESLSLALPWIEITLGTALVIGLWRCVTIPAALLLLAAYTLLTAQAWWRGLPIECGCLDFSGFHPALAFLETPAGSTLRNLGLLLVTAAVSFLQTSKDRLP
ncbi:MAG: MauE/DoxX family redox-associated membrane protein [Terrimicrobiaceae bacterium]